MWKGLVLVFGVLVLSAVCLAHFDADLITEETEFTEESFRAFYQERLSARALEDNGPSMFPSPAIKADCSASEGACFTVFLDEEASPRPRYFMQNCCECSQYATFRYASTRYNHINFITGCLKPNHKAGLFFMDPIEVQSNPLLAPPRLISHENCDDC
ncbi:hypothetical protein QOT17_012761 [Balamuthia mandrillaris]